MSRHEMIHANNKWVFGWDQPLMSFFLQVHDNNLSEEENPVIWLDRDMYEVEDLVREAKKTGLAVTHTMQVLLYSEKDDGI